MGGLHPDQIAVSPAQGRAKSQTGERGWMELGRSSSTSQRGAPSSIVFFFLPRQTPIYTAEACCLLPRHRLRRLLPSKRSSGIPTIYTRRLSSPLSPCKHLSTERYMRPSLLKLQLFSSVTALRVPRMVSLSCPPPQAVNVFSPFSPNHFGQRRADGGRFWTAPLSPWSRLSRILNVLSALTRAISAPL